MMQHDRLPEPYSFIAVDDDSVFLAVLGAMMCSLGHPNIEVAMSGNEALDLLRRRGRPFDCMLLDVDMPEMNGIELCGRIRALPGYARTPICIVTSLCSKHSVEAAFQAGATDFLTKPLQKVELTARLRVLTTLASHHRSTDYPSNAPATPLNLVPKSMSFGEPIDLAAPDIAMSYHAFHSYLRNITRFELRNLTFFRFEIINSRRYHQIGDAEVYVDFLRDAASAIMQSLGPDAAITYAGHGYIVGFCAYRDDLGCHVLNDRLRFHISKKSEKYRVQGIQLPLVTTDKSIKVRMFDKRSQEDIVRHIFSDLGIAFLEVA